MKLMIALAGLALLAAATPRGAADTQTPEAAAKAAAEAAASTWLAFIDSGDYAQSWSTAAERFRNSIPQQQWAAIIAQVRGSLGSFKSRRLAAATFTTSLPGAPAGEYVVIEYSASFAGKPEAVETVTPMKDPDGHWRVSGYYIK